MAKIGTRIVILLASVGLALVGAADAAFADPQPASSDGYGYDRNGTYNDGMGYDRNGVFDDGMGYTDDNSSSDDFNCYDNGARDAYDADNCGWYNGSFYPGFGAFVFDRHHHRHHMTGRQHDYFTRQARGPDGGRRVGLGSSGGFGGSRGGSSGGFRGGGHGG
ncbi:MAG TPA: hypothetical protein VK485_00540 [Sphingomicrobium sp.]|nr:hypothetical protein [Sphingomicrobium sp.]